MIDSLTCPACKGKLPRAALSNGSLQPCPLCDSQLYVEFFPAADKAPPPILTGEPITSDEEAACFHHVDRKAAAVCAECGRFLCRLCDLEVDNAHYCASCLEQKRKEGRDARWVTSRVVWDELAFHLALWAWVGVVFLSPLAWVLAWRHRQAPGSLVRAKAWRIPAALVLSSLHLLLMIALLIWLAVRWPF